MADSTPLLTQHDSTESKSPPSFDDMIEQCIGDFGWTQFMQSILVSFAWVFDAQQTFISIFTDAEPKWHCTDQLSAESCNSVTNICQLSPNSSSSWSWDNPLHTSIISDWGLECASSLIKGLPASSFFMGCLLGGLVLATLADSSLGRKNLLFLSCLLMSLSSLLTTFSTNVWIYSFLRFVNGFGRATIGTCALVLSTELVGKKWRGRVGIVGFLCFTLGFLSLPVIAYINRGSSWRNLYLWTSIPTIFYCILVRLFILESPRWLFVQGRKAEAVAVLQCIATCQMTTSFSELSIEQETWNVDLYSSIKILVQKRWAFRRLTMVVMTGFGIGMVYYGMPLGLQNLKFNLYLSVTFNALSELPASLVAFMFINRLNRRTSLVGFATLSGVCSIMCVVLGKTEWSTENLQIGLEMTSFFGACTAFNVCLIYTLELFPTCVRNSALAIVREALVAGGVFSPILVAAGRGSGGFWSYGLFGVVIMSCGLFVVGLPETRGGKFCDTMDEEEHKVRSAACGV